ncbi:hypothetical protein JMUB7532_27710 [Staphylococcus aureus]
MSRGLGDVYKRQEQSFTDGRGVREKAERESRCLLYTSDAADD